MICVGGALQFYFQILCLLSVNINFAALFLHITVYLLMCVFRRIGLEIIAEAKQDKRRPHFRQDEDKQTQDLPT